MRYILIFSLIIGKFCLAQNNANPSIYSPNIFFESAYGFGITTENINTINFTALFGHAVSRQIWLGAGFGVNHIISKNTEGNMYPVFVEVSNFQASRNPKSFYSARLGAVMAGNTTFPYFGLRMGTRSSTTGDVRVSFFAGLDFTKITIQYYESYGSFNSTPEVIMYTSILLGLSLSF
jgi:hypothetical protein